MKKERLKHLKKQLVSLVRNDGERVFFLNTGKNIWENLSDCMAIMKIKKIMAGAQEELSVAEAKEVLREIASSPEFYDPLQEPVPNLINCKNGTYDIANGMVRKATVGGDFRLQLDFTFDDKAAASKCPQFIKFLRFAYDLSRDQDIDEILKMPSVKRLMEMMGYMVSNEWRAKKMLVIIGPANSGKSQILELIRRVVGYENATSLNLEDLSGHGGGRFRTDLLRNAHVNINDELPTRGLRHLSEYKKLISGEGLTVEAKGKKPVTIKNRTKLVFAGNQLPELAEADCGNAFADRLLITAFRKSIDSRNRDVALVDKLYAERDIIFSLAVQLFSLVVQNSFTFSNDEDSEKMLKAYIENNSTITTFITDSTVVTNGDGIHTTRLFHRYIEYCEENALKPLKSLTAFRQQLANMPNISFSKRRLEGDENPRSVVDGVELVGTT